VLKGYHILLLCHNIMYAVKYSQEKYYFRIQVIAYAQSPLRTKFFPTSLDFDLCPASAMKKRV